jgi:hypothetical protein
LLLGKRETALAITDKEQGILLKRSSCWDFYTESTSTFSHLQQNSLLDGAGNFYRKNREFGHENREFNPSRVKGRLFFGPPNSEFRNNIRLQCLAAAMFRMAEGRKMFEASGVGDQKSGHLANV